jgi:GNAT superfamily N-acetyltransferase
MTDQPRRSLVSIARFQPLATSKDGRYAVGELKRGDIAHAADALSRLNELLAQVSKSAKPMTVEYLRDMLDRPDVHLYVVVDQQTGDFVAMTTRIENWAPSGVKSWIEDVVVDEVLRGRGIAKLMLAAVIADAPAEVKHINLTTAKGVGAVYESLGFVVRDTVVYRLAA